MSAPQYMPIPEMRRISQIHFVGIGGAGMGAHRCGVRLASYKKSEPPRTHHKSLGGLWFPKKKR